MRLAPLALTLDTIGKNGMVGAASAAMLSLWGPERKHRD
jgi:hypothetical protein